MAGFNLIYKTCGYFEVLSYWDILLFIKYNNYKIVWLFHHNFLWYILLRKFNICGIAFIIGGCTRVVRIYQIIYHFFSNRQYSLCISLHILDGFLTLLNKLLYQ